MNGIISWSFSFKTVPFQKRIGVQDSKEEDIKVVSLVGSGEKVQVSLNPGRQQNVWISQPLQQLSLSLL